MASDRDPFDDDEPFEPFEEGSDPTEVRSLRVGPAPDALLIAETAAEVANPITDKPRDAAGRDVPPRDAMPRSATDTVDVEPEDEAFDDASDISSLVGEIPWHDGRVGPVCIVFAGGNGGAGRTLLVANVGLFLSRLGRTVLVADLDPAGSNLHTYLGLDPLLPNPGALLRPAGPPRLDVLSGMNLTLCRPPRPMAGAADDSLRAEALAAARAADVDVLVLDVGATPDAVTLDCFLEADCGVVVVTPDPVSMERCYAFLRAALYRRLLHGDDEPAVVSRALLSADHVGQLDTPADLVDALAGVHPNAAEAIRARVLAFAPKLLINRCRSRADRDMAVGMVSALRRRWSINAEALGGLDHDDTATESLRRRRPLVVEYPGSALARDIERVSRRLLAIAVGREVRQ